MKHPENRRIGFAKMSGAGNDFVVVDNRQGFISDPSLFAQRVCDRRRGIGADGLLLMERSKRAAFLMKYYNADGSSGGMCGNGGRCISRFAFLKGIVSSPELRFEALDHVYRASMLKNIVRLKMKSPGDVPLNRRLVLLGRKRILYHYLNTGAPHCVVLSEENESVIHELRTLNVDEVGRKIRHHSRFAPDGVNVNFVEITDRSTIRIRTYERGVETETLACGTGAIASALVSHRIGRVLSPVTVHTQGGEPLTVEFTFVSGGRYKDVELQGSAEVIYEGSLQFDFARQRVITEK